MHSFANKQPVFHIAISTATKNKRELYCKGKNENGYQSVGVINFKESKQRSGLSIYYKHRKS
jgi:hypothetical protein